MKLKDAVKKLLYPPIWLMALLSVISAVMLALIFIKGWEESYAAYAAYVLSFYTLSVVCIFFAAVLPKRYKEIKNKVYGNPLGNRYLTDTEFRVRVSLYIALAINLLYSAFKLISGIYYSSFWIGAVAVYYLLLSLIRFLLLRYMRTGRQDIIAEYRRYRLTAALMMLINLTLSGIVLNMIAKNESAAYSDIYVITSAAYTFYTLTVSVIDIVKYRRYHSPVISASKAIRFAAALVSLLSLEASMLVQFGEDEAFRKLMLALTGAGVCVMVLGMSVYMLVVSTGEIKKLTENENGKQR